MPVPAAKPWVFSDTEVLLTVRLTPKGGRDAVDGIARMADGSYVLKTRVRVAARDGEANAALVRLLAGAVGVPARDVSLVAGASARVKQIKITGSGPKLTAALEKICAIG